MSEFGNFVITLIYVTMTGLLPLHLINGMSLRNKGMYMQNICTTVSGLHLSCFQSGRLIKTFVKHVDLFMSVQNVFIA